MTLTVINGGRDKLEQPLVKSTLLPDVGPHVRLTQREIKQLTALTGSDPKNIRTGTQLINFIQAHLVNYPGRNPEEKLLRVMLESFLPDRLDRS